MTERAVQIIFMMAVLPIFDYSVLSANETRIYKVKDFGAVGNGVADDGNAIRDAIYAAVKSEHPAIVYFEGNKVYRAGGRSDRWESFDLIEANNVVIDGDGATLLLSPHTRGFLLEKSRNCAIRNFIIDYDPLPFTQGDIVAADHNNCAFDVKLHNGFPVPPPDENNYIDLIPRCGTVFSSQDPARWYGVVGHGHIMIERIDNIQDRIFRVVITKEYRDFLDSKLLRIGDQFAFGIRYCCKERYQKLKGVPFANIQIANSADCILENIRQFCSPGQSVALTDNQGRITIRNYNIQLKPGSGRLLANLSDGIHCKGNRIGPIIENCFFQGLLDDSVNISCMAEVVQKKISEKSFLVTAAVAWYVPTIDIGDVMQIIDPFYGHELGRRVVTNVEYRQGQDRVITFNKSIEGVVPADANEKDKATWFFNISRAGNDYIIKNNKFQYQTRSGMNLRASGLIERNDIIDVGGHGIYINNDIQFKEGPIPENIIIRNNTISGCSRNTGIAVRFDAYKKTDICGIKNIIIENNKISGLGFGSGIQLINVENAKIFNNDITTGMAYEPKGNRFLPPILIENSSDICISGGLIIDTRDRIEGGVVIKGCKDDAISISNVDFKLSALVRDIVRN